MKWFVFMLICHIALFDSCLVHLEVIRLPWFVEKIRCLRFYLATNRYKVSFDLPFFWKNVFPHFARPGRPGRAGPGREFLALPIQKVVPGRSGRTFTKGTRKEVPGGCGWENPLPDPNNARVNFSDSLVIPGDLLRFSGKSALETGGSARREVRRRRPASARMERGTKNRPQS